VTEDPQSVVRPVVMHSATPDLLPVTSLFELFGWYKRNLCDRSFKDPRGYWVQFEETDFVHLIKLKDSFGKEPRNARMTIEQIKSGRIKFNPSRLDIRRATELS